MTRYPFGTDYKLTLDDGALDVDTTFAVETDQTKVLLADIVKIVTTGQGVMWWAPTASEDVTELLNDSITAENLSDLQSRLKAALDQDPRFEDSTVLVTMASCDLRVAISAKTANQSIALTLVRREDGTLEVTEVSSGTV